MKTITDQREGVLEKIGGGVYDMSASFFSETLDLQNEHGFSIHAKLSNLASIDGTFTLQYSNIKDESDSDESNWVDDPSSSKAIDADDIPGHLWDRSSVQFKYVRVKFASTAGDGDVEFHYFSKRSV